MGGLADAAGVGRTRLGLLPELGRCPPEILPRAVVYYTRLCALPRRVRRALQRQWRLPLTGVALLLALGQSPGQAATIPVGGACTLIDAITAANTDTATGGCVAGSGADTIVLPAGSTQTLTEVNNSTYGLTGLPVISSVMTIAGQGSTIVRASDALEFRLLAVNSTGELTLQETTLSGGAAPVDDGGGVVTYRSGGGVANYGGTLTVMNSTISGNSAAEYCYRYCYSGSGGGVANISGTLTMLNSIISGNSVLASGGGVYNRDGTVTVTNSTIAGNPAADGGGVTNIGGTVTVTNSTISDNYGGVANSGGTLIVMNSTISGNSGGGVGNGFGGTVTLTNTTISGNSGGGVANSGYRGSTVTLTDSTISGNYAGNGGGVYNSGTLTVLNSTISGNSARFSGGGVHNGGVHAGITLTVLNSTISGNSISDCPYCLGLSGGGVNNRYGATLTVLNSTISGNTVGLSGSLFDQGGGVANDGTLIVLSSTISGNTTSANGGGVANGGTFILAHTLVSGNTAPTGPEIANSGTVLADNHNLFGVDGNAGVVGFSPGATDIVPPAGILLPDILHPTLARNGGHTQTHALVPGSPAIDAGGVVCTDANNDPLLTDQRGRPRLVDGNGDGTATCDIGAFEFFPIVNDFVTLDPSLEIAFDPTPVPGGPAGTFTITATFTNTSDTALRVPFFLVTELSGGNLLLNAEEETQGVGATLTPDVGDSVLAPGEAVTVDFVIGLQEQAPFTFLVDLFGEPLL